MFNVEQYLLSFSVISDKGMKSITVRNPSDQTRIGRQRNSSKSRDSGNRKKKLKSTEKSRQFSTKILNWNVEYRSIETQLIKPELVNKSIASNLVILYTEDIKLKKIKIAFYQSQREISTVASREAPRGLGLKSNPKDYHQKLTN